MSNKMMQCSLSQETHLKVRIVACSSSALKDRTIVLLQDTIDSHIVFRELPELLAQATNASIIQYDRSGQGGSTGFVLDRKPGNDFVFRESERLTTLFQLLRVDPTKTVLVGFGDGAAIALAHAVTAPQTVRGVVMMNPRSLNCNRLFQFHCFFVKKTDLLWNKSCWMGCLN
jgi:pimeloyl-ACP methyl ester carboxylesterase